MGSGFGIGGVGSGCWGREVGVEGLESGVGSGGWGREGRGGGVGLGGCFYGKLYLCAMIFFFQKKNCFCWGGCVAILYSILLFLCKTF